MDDFDMLNAPNAGNGVGSEEDPAAAFLAQQECEIAGIENDEGFSILDSGEVPLSMGDTNGQCFFCSSSVLLFFFFFWMQSQNANVVVCFKWVINRADAPMALPLANLLAWLVFS